MKKTAAKFILLCFIVMGCAPIMKLKYGITKPKRETCESLAKYLKRHNYPVSSFYVFGDSASYYHVYKSKAINKYLLSTIIVDKDFRMILPDTTHCQWSGGYIIDHLNKNTSYTTEPAVDIKSLLSKIRCYPDSTSPDLAKGDFDFIVINTWAKFIGQMNERLFMTMESAKERKDLNIKVINLNLDVQKSWNVPDKQMIAFN